MGKLESEVGRKFNVHRIYEAWTRDPVTSVVRSDVANGRVPAISIKPFNRRTKTIIPWARVADGSEDATITAQADAFKALGKRVILAFHHEPENDTAYGTPRDFVAAWRHYVSVYRSRGANNVEFAWIMTSYSFRQDASVAAQFYPGDDAVDWLGVDGYNWFTCKNAPWRPFSAVFANFRKWAAAHPKPIFIAEFGTPEDPADPGRKGQWFREAAATLKSWTQVKALAYFDSDLGKHCGWSVNSSPTAIAGFRVLANGFRQ